MQGGSAGCRITKVLRRREGDQGKAVGLKGKDRWKPYCGGNVVMWSTPPGTDESKRETAEAQDKAEDLSLWDWAYREAFNRIR